MEELGFVENTLFSRRSADRRRSARRMSDSDDEEHVSQDFAFIFALAEMNSAAADASSSTAAPEKKKMCDLCDFKAPTQDDVEWNVVVQKENLLEKTDAFTEGDRPVGKALVGRLDKDLALPLYETTLQHMNVEHGGAKIFTTDGKKQSVTTLPGINNYDLHVGEHDAKAQKRATVLIDAAMLTTKSKEVGLSCTPSTRRRRSGSAASSGRLLRTSCSARALRSRSSTTGT